LQQVSTTKRWSLSNARPRSGGRHISVASGVTAFILADLTNTALLDFLAN